MRASPVLRLVRPEISRFPCKERACMPGSPTTPGRPSACVDALGHVAFRYTDSVGTREQFSIAAQWLACTYPYRRFAGILANDSARLGADVVRYSFIAVDLHHLLLAGLPAHPCENPSQRGFRGPLTLLEVEKIDPSPIERLVFLWKRRRAAFSHGLGPKRPDDLSDRSPRKSPLNVTVESPCCGPQNLGRIRTSAPPT